MRRLIPLRERETCACTMATSPTARLYDERPHEPGVSAWGAGYSALFGSTDQPD